MFLSEITGNKEDVLMIELNDALNCIGRWLHFSGFILKLLDYLIQFKAKIV